MRARAHLVLARLARSLALAACVVAAGVGTASAASAAHGPSAVIADCQAHGKLTQSYTVSVLHDALVQIPADISQYSDCADVITRAERAALSTGKFIPSGDDGSGGSFLPTWLIVVLVVLALGAATLTAVAVRRRRAP